MRAGLGDRTRECCGGRWGLERFGACGVALGVCGTGERAGDRLEGDLAL